MRYVPHIIKPSYQRIERGRTDKQLDLFFDGTNYCWVENGRVDAFKDRSPDQIQDFIKARSALARSYLGAALLSQTVERKLAPPDKRFVENVIDIGTVSVFIGNLLSITSDELKKEVAQQGLDPEMVASNLGSFSESHDRLHDELGLTLRLEVPYAVVLDTNGLPRVLDPLVRDEPDRLADSRIRAGNRVIDDHFAARAHMRELVDGLLAA